MNFKINNAYLECLDFSYDNIYLNRYIDSLNVINYISTTDTDHLKKLYFNFVDKFQNNITKDINKTILDNLEKTNSNLLNAIKNLNLLYPNILFNSQILYFRNISDFISTVQNLFLLEEYIENLYPKCYLILNTDIDLSAMGYEYIKNNNYIKKLY